MVGKGEMTFMVLTYKLMLKALLHNPSLRNIDDRVENSS
jgi:hypothetical protein